MYSNILFDNLEDALIYHKIHEDDFYINSVEHPNSLERFTYNDNIFYHIGKGYKLYPGYPLANQMWYNQLKLVNKFAIDNNVPVFRLFMDGKVAYIGNYTFDRYRKKIGENGFTYFEFKLLKKKRFWI